MAEDTFLDLKGLKCPLPVLRTRKAMQALAPGARVIVDTTDPLAAIDIPNYCREAGHTLESHEKTEDGIRFTLVRGN